MLRITTAQMSIYLLQMLLITKNSVYEELKRALKSVRVDIRTIYYPKYWDRAHKKSPSPLEWLTETLLERAWLWLIKWQEVTGNLCQWNLLEIHPPELAGISRILGKAVPVEMSPKNLLQNF